MPIKRTFKKWMVALLQGSSWRWLLVRRAPPTTTLLPEYGILAEHRASYARYEPHHKEVVVPSRICTSALTLLCNPLSPGCRVFATHLHSSDSVLARSEPQTMVNGEGGKRRSLIASLMSASSAYRCLVWDFGSRDKKGGVPRAVWYGLEFLRYAASTVWLKGTHKAFLRGYNVSKDFDHTIRNLSKSAKKYDSDLAAMQLGPRYCSTDVVHLMLSMDSICHCGPISRTLYFSSIVRSRCHGAKAPR